MTMSRLRFWLLPILWCLTLLSGKLLPLAILGWTFLFILGFFDFDSLIYSSFFYATFFHPTELFPNSVFTIKHFQISIFLFSIVYASQLLRRKVTLPHLNGVIFLLPPVLLFLISLFSAALTHQLRSSFSYHLNLLVTWFSVLVLGTSIIHRKNLLKTCVLLFVSGMSVQILGCFVNLAFNIQIFTLHIIHNNHIGIQSAFCIFYPLCILALDHENTKAQKVFSYFLLIILFLGMIFACCRNAYIVFCALYVLFLFLLRWTPDPMAKKKSRFFALMLPIGLIPFVLISMLINFDVLARFASIFLEVLNPDSWVYSFSDKANFGFLGLFRLVQFYEILDILKVHPLFGMGMTHRALEFHGLYLTVLAATGISGLLLLAFFCRQLLHASLVALRSLTHLPTFALMLGAYLAVLLWLLCGFLETFLLQFSPWINLLFLATIASSYGKRES